MLEHDPETVDMARCTVLTYLQRTTEGPFGFKAFARQRTKRGYRMRGERFGSGTLDSIPTNTAYIGYAINNRQALLTDETRPESEQVPIPVPPFIDKKSCYAFR